MALFIGNPTKQVQQLFYRVPEVANLQDESIPMGGQISVAAHRNLTRAQLEGILAQHLPHGLIEAKDVPKVKGRIGLVYQWDKPINFERLHLGIEQNDDEALKISDQVLLEQSAATIENLQSITGKEVDREQTAINIIEVDQTRAGKKRQVRQVRAA